jgi:ABC-type nitrate/sulfonate/bicarbonate transport system permease component
MKAPSGSRFPKLLPFCLPLLGPLGMLAIWQAIASSGWVNPVLFPPPIATLAELSRLLLQPEHSLLPDLWMTGSRTLQAFAIAAGWGVPLGIGLGSSVRLYRSVEFVIDFFRSTPSSALIPLFLVLFGIHDFNKVIVAAFTTSLAILFYSAHGVMNADKSRILAARVMGANACQIFRDVLFWESLPQTFVGLRLGISLALVIVIVAEMLMGAEIGLGQRILNAQQVLSIKEMYAAILLTGGLGYGLNLVCLAIERRVVHWRRKS